MPRSQVTAIVGEESSPKWLTAAIHELGVQEIAGKMANPRIVDYLSTCKTLPDPLKQSDETAWCSAFVNWCMARSGETGTGLANARSWLKWGSPLKQPKRGCVVVFSRDNAGPTGGHVAFYLAHKKSANLTANMIEVLGGNQRNRVCVQLYPEHRVLGYRWSLEP